MVKKSSALAGSHASGSCGWAGLSGWGQDMSFTLACKNRKENPVRARAPADDMDPRQISRVTSTRLRRAPDTILADYGNGTAPVRPQAVPVDMGGADGDVPVSITSTPPGHDFPLTVTVAATIRMLMGP